MAILRPLVGKGFFHVPDEQLEAFAVSDDAARDALKDSGVRIGIAATAEEAQGKPTLRLAPMEAQAGDATASYMRYNTAICPHCGTPNRVLEDTERYLYFTCYYCNNTFRF